MITNVHLAQLVLNTPLAIDPSKLDTILQVLGPKFLGKSVQSLERFEDTEDEHNDFVSEFDSSVVVIPIVGTLVNRTMGLEAFSGLTSYHAIREELELALINPSVKGIILDIDSPGGEVSGLFDLASFVKSVSQQKPMMAIVDEEAYSAAYALASATGNVFLPQTGGAGSVGVLAVHVDESQRDEKEGLVYSFVSSGTQKAEFNSHEPLSSDARSRLQERVNSVYQIFARTVSENMPVSLEALNELQGGIVFGQDALELGLVTKVQSKADAIEEFIDQYGSSHYLSNQEGSGMKPKHVVVKSAVEGDLNKTQETKEGAVGKTQENTSPDLVLSDSEEKLVNAILGVDDSKEDVLSSSYVKDIFSTCRLAGKPELAEKFIEKKVPLGAVKKALINGKAKDDEAEEIVSASAPLQEEKTVKKESNIDIDLIYTNRKKQMVG